MDEVCTEGTGAIDPLKRASDLAEFVGIHVWLCGEPRTDAGRKAMRDASHEACRLTGFEICRPAERLDDRQCMGRIKAPPAGFCC